MHCRAPKASTRAGRCSRMLDVWSLVRSKGGLAVHRCARQEEGGQTFRSTLEDQTTESLTVRSPERETTWMRGASMQAENVTVECKECGRTFRRTSDRKKHKCLAERAKPVKEQRSALQCSKCQKWFCSRGGTSCAQVEREQRLTETPAAEDSALLAPFSLSHVTKFGSGQTGQDRCVCVCVGWLLYNCIIVIITTKKLPPCF